MRSAEARADLAHCAHLLRQGSRSFHAATRMLPRAVRRDILPIYAFCRVADDAVDGVRGSLATVEVLRRRLDAIYAGAPHADPVDRALARVVRRHVLPRSVFDALLEGFEWEFAGRELETEADVRAYAARVAGSVGVLVSFVMGRRDPVTLSRACDLGIAMQLTNIARDVGEDARRGRIYLPLAWFRKANLDPQTWLHRPDASPAVRNLVRRLLVEADRLYRRAEGGIPHLPVRCQPAIWAARFLYADIGRRIAAAGFDSVAHRAATSGSDKLRTVATALLACIRHARIPAGAGGPPLPEARFLVTSDAAVG